MTVSSDDARAGPYTGNGVTTVFSVPFMFLQDDDLVVLQTVTATGVVTIKTLNSDYTVTGAGDENGGSVTFSVAPASTVKITIVNQPDATQTTEFVDGDPLPAASVEGALDKLTLLYARAIDLWNRSLHLADGDVGGASVELPTTRASKYLYFDASGNPTAVSVLTTGALAVSAFIETLLDDSTAATARSTLAMNFAGNKGSDIASANSITLPSDGTDVYDITGTTTINSLSTRTAGAVVVLQFDGALTLTYNATSMVLPTSASITTAAGDIAAFVSEGAGNWRCFSYLRRSGAPLALAAGSVTNSILGAGSVTGDKISTGGPGSRNASYSNLVVQVTSNTAWTVTADEIIVEDSSNTYKTLRAVSLTGGIATSGANGLDTGAEASNTWYYVFVIAKSDGTTATLISTSSTAPTMPTGYTYKARVGAIRNDGSSNLYRIIQYGSRTQYVVGTNPSVLPNLANGTKGSHSDVTPTYTTQSVSSWVPPTAGVINLVVGAAYNNGASSDAIAAPNNGYSGVRSTNPPPFAAASNDVVVRGDMILESTNIYIAGSGAGSGWWCAGYTDNL